MRRACSRRLACAVIAMTCGHALATDITVTRFDDPTPAGCAPTDCSLREAIIQSNAFVGPDRILLGAGVYTLSIFGANEDAAQTGDLDIKDDLIVLGASAATTTVKWDLRADRLFDIMGSDPGPERHVTLARMTLQGGGAPTGAGSKSGGGIQAFGFNLDFRLTDVTLHDNFAQAGAGGGAIIDTSHATLGNVDATDNEALRGGGLFVALNGPQLSIVGLTATGNHADRCGAAEIIAATFTPMQATLRNLIVRNNFADHDGGGLCLGGYNPGMVLSDSFIDGNLAGNSGAGRGGGIFINGVTPDADGVGATLEIRTSQISNNTAKGFGGGISFGNDALALNGGACEVEIVSSTISSNHAIDSHGGGIYSDPGTSPCPLRISEGSLIQGNEATAVTNDHGNGGGVFANNALIVLDSTLRDNHAEGLGGGMYLSSDSAAIVSRCTLASNSAPQYGGGIETFATSLTIDNSTLDGNTAIQGATVDNNSKPVYISASTLARAPGDLSEGTVYDNTSGFGSVPQINKSILAGTCANAAPAANNRNLESPFNTCNLGGTSIAGVTPAQLALDLLADNGGPTPTRKLLAGSIAIGVVPVPCGSVDQRGYARLGQCDIGAYESDGLSDRIFSSGFEFP